jgi:hypothetical protein
MMGYGGGRQPGPIANTRASGGSRGLADFLQYLKTRGVAQSFADQGELLIVYLDLACAHPQLDDSATCIANKYGNKAKVGAMAASGGMVARVLSQEKAEVRWASCKRFALRSQSRPLAATANLSEPSATSVTQSSASGMISAKFSTDHQS